ncbi:hypothetical protein Pyn_17491 [Prunus yedoensis var. nudiflora]|uniref:Uncharacterized protein n=1 Tax=Prunus yedoensis var. nudiflora TaxID=2094558 RepID=A0A314YN84_PRUYE|nr:hypothetical protein Pyn_17491 [Prunus yedoensis var. nudiflora]
MPRRTRQRSLTRATEARQWIPAVGSRLRKPVRGSGAVVVPTRYGPERGGVLSDGGSGRQWLIDDKELQRALSSYNELQLEAVHLLMYLFTPIQHQEDR